jgi:hypothetical protein
LFVMVVGCSVVYVEICVPTGGAFMKL